MVMTIGPAGGEAERRRMMRWHAAGVALGSLTMALVLTVLGALVLPPVSGVDDAVALGASGVVIGWALRSTFGWGLPYPRSHWQVPEHWRYTLPPAFTALAYGMLLGLGFLTDVVLAAYWVLVVGTVVVASLPLALAGWAIYAATRVTVTRGAITRAGFDREPSGGDHADLQPATCTPGARALTSIRVATGGVLAAIAATIAAATVI